jgi:hypothetical protein
MYKGIQYLNFLLEEADVLKFNARGTSSLHRNPYTMKREEDFDLILPKIQIDPIGRTSELLQSNTRRFWCQEADVMKFKCD